MYLLRQCLGLSLLLSVACYGESGIQQASSNPSTDQASQSVFQAGSNLVLVPSLVRDKAGNLVYSLEVRDFSLLDNGLLQKLYLTQDAAPQPLALIVVLQCGGNGVRQQEYLRGLGTMIDQFVASVPHRIALICFGSQVSMVEDFTSNMERIQEKLKHPPETEGGSAILDAVAVALQKLDFQPKGYRKAILLVSERIDHNSKTSKDEIVRLIGKSNTTIYSVAFSPAMAQWKDALTGPGQGNPPYNLSVLLPPVVGYFNLKPLVDMAIGGMGRNAAEEMAQLSGGAYIHFDNQKEFDRDIGRIGNYVHNQYMLSFQPSNATEGFHALHVDLNQHPDMSVNSRTSYWLEKQH